MLTAWVAALPRVPALGGGAEVVRLVQRAAGGGGGAWRCAFHVTSLSSIGRESNTKPTAKTQTTPTCSYNKNFSVEQPRGELRQPGRHRARRGGGAAGAAAAHWGREGEKP
eukprot:3212720-Pyramimonas_sp.AAC.2